MQKNYGNIYQMARRGAGISQEAAAELLHLSVESVRAYETGQTVPPNETVVLMTKAYGASWLPIKHLSQTARPLGVLPEVTVQQLPTATLQLINRMAEFSDHYRRLMQIAEDGVIDEDELPDFVAISEELRDIVACALQVLYPADTKKDRPEAGTSKRSRSGKPETTHASIIPRSRNIARNFYAQSAEMRGAL